MRKLILLSAIFAFISCVSRKSVVEKTTDVVQSKIEVQSEEKVVSETTLKSDVFSAEEIKLIESKTDEFNSRLLIYDTSLPIDKETGRPPLKAELVKSSKTNINSESIITSNQKANTDLKIDSEQTSNVEHSEKAVVKKEAIKKDVKPVLSWPITIVLVLIFAATFIYLYFHYVKKISIFSLLRKLFF